MIIGTLTRNILRNPVGYDENVIPINNISFYINDDHRDFNDKDRALTLTDVRSHRKCVVNLTAIIINGNSQLLKPGDEYMCIRTGPSLIQVMACRLFGAKSLTKPMVTYCQLDP